MQKHGSLIDWADTLLAELNDLDSISTFVPVFPCCSPPVRWGLFDFMSASSPPLRPSPPRPPPRFLLPSASNVPCWTSSATMWVQCSLTDVNARNNVRGYARKNFRQNAKRYAKNVRQNVRNVRRDVRKTVRKNVRRDASKKVRNIVRRYAERLS